MLFLISIPSKSIRQGLALKTILDLNIVYSYRLVKIILYENKE